MYEQIIKVTFIIVFIKNIRMLNEMGKEIKFSLL
jgi:hypothetical protein